LISMLSESQLDASYLEGGSKVDETPPTTSNEISEEKSEASKKEKKEKDAAASAKAK